MLDKFCDIIQLQSPLWDQDKASLTFSTYIFFPSLFLFLSQ